MILGSINDENTTAEDVEEYFGPVEACIFADFAADNKIHTFIEVLEAAKAMDCDTIH